MQPILLESNPEVQAHAKREIDAYRKMAAEMRTTEDEAVARMYREQAKGRTLVDVPESIRQAGLNDQGLPVLACARAGYEFVYCRREQDRFHMTTAVHGSGSWYEGSPDFNRRGGHHHFFVPWQNEKWNFVTSWRAPIPIVPMQYRTRFKLSNYHLLWEVERWDEAPKGDPILLKHLISGVYVVLAQWDLTDVEAAVLRGRMLEQ